MPELPEVRTTKYYLNKFLQGQTILKIDVYVPKMIKDISSKQFINTLKNKKFLFVKNVAKFLVFHLEDNVIMLSHLRMEGKYRLESNYNKGKNDHIIFHLKNHTLIYNDTRQFGTFHIRTKENYLNILPLSKLGPEPSRNILNKIYDKLQKKRVAIKTALLDQTIVAGLGNIYVNEVLWETKTHPLIPSNMISKIKLKAILITAKKIMDEATKKGGATINSYLSFNNKKGGYQSFLKIHGKTKEKCSRCQNQIQKIQVNKRGTYYCSICQKVNFKIKKF